MYALHLVLWIRTALLVALLLSLHTAFVGHDPSLYHTEIGRIMLSMVYSRVWRRHCPWQCATRSRCVATVPLQPTSPGTFTTNETRQYNSSCTVHSLQVSIGRFSRYKTQKTGLSCLHSHDCLSSIRTIVNCEWVLGFAEVSGRLKYELKSPLCLCARATAMRQESGATC